MTDVERAGLEAIVEAGEIHDELSPAVRWIERQLATERRRKVSVSAICYRAVSRRRS